MPVSKDEPRLYYQPSAASNTDYEEDPALMTKSNTLRNNYNSIMEHFGEEDDTLAKKGTNETSDDGFEDNLRNEMNPLVSERLYLGTTLSVKKKFGGLLFAGFNTTTRTYTDDELEKIRLVIKAIKTILRNV